MIFFIILEGLDLIYFRAESPSLNMEAFYLKAAI